MHNSFSFFLFFFVCFCLWNISTEATFNKRANDDFRQFCHDNSPFWHVYHLEMWAQLNVLHILSRACCSLHIRPLCLRTSRENNQIVGPQKVFVMRNANLYNTDSLIISACMSAPHIIFCGMYFIQLRVNDNVLAFHFKLHAIFTIFMCFDTIFIVVHIA